MIRQVDLWTGKKKNTHRNIHRKRLEFKCEGYREILYNSNFLRHSMYDYKAAEILLFVRNNISQNEDGSHFYCSVQQRPPGLSVALVERVDVFCV